MNKEDLIKIVNNNSTFDIDGSIKYVDVLDYGKLVNELLEAITVTRCCETLKDNRCEQGQDYDCSCTDVCGIGKIKI